MEKKEAIREWAIDKALTLLASYEGQYDVEEVVKVAEKLEKYITK